MKKGLRSGDKQFSLLLLAPAVIITVIFILVPVVDSIYRSFFDYKVKILFLENQEPGIILQTMSNYSQMENFQQQ